MWNLVKEHCSSISHKKSHYNGKKTERKFFVNSDLTVKKLHTFFLEFYNHKTGEDCKLKYKAYHKFFRSNSEYSIRQRKIDVCDCCTECTVKLSADPHDSCAKMYRIHKLDSKLRSTQNSEMTIYQKLLRRKSIKR